jgi:hypothetical protein
MNPLWNALFALLLVVGIWCRLRAPEVICRALAPVLGFFGVAGVPVGRACGDLFVIAGTAGLLFVAWSDRIAIGADLFLGIDTLVTALGLGLVGAWGFARAEQTSTVDDLLDEADEWEDVGKLPPARSPD